MQKIIPLVADSTGLVLTAAIPGDFRYAVIGISGSQEFGVAHNLEALTSNGSSPISGEAGFRLDALLAGTNGPQTFFPGPGLRSAGIPGAAWVVEQNASVKLTLSSSGVSGVAANTSEDRASCGLIVVPIANDTPLALIPRVRIVGAQVAWSAATEVSETQNLPVIGQFANSTIRILRLQARKTNLGGGANLAFAGTNFLSIQRKDGGLGRVPIRGRIVTDALAGTSNDQLAGLQAGSIDLELMAGEYMTIDMLESGDGVAASKRADFVFLAFELEN